ncbi:MAG TPA: hypothetical protein PKJ97_01635 [Candidatus Bilamarchaeaceae archaeon]|nr:hypothetical protein [Candidatus Bilamarchaeaceae archaeon]
MRPTTSLVVGLLLLLPAAFSADLTQYLAPGEAITDQSTFIVGGVPYTLVYIGGEPTFLIDGSHSIITDHALIGRVVNKHFTDLYYPTDAEIAALRADFGAYHDSRNNGDDYPNTKVQLPGMKERMGMEEEVCRYSMFLNVFPCTNSSNCHYTALFMCEEYGDALGCSKLSDIQPDIESFSFASNRLTECEKRAEELFDNMNGSNIRESLVELKAMIPGMLEDEAALESTRFRLPRGEDRCRDCIGLCPRILIDEEHLEGAEVKIDALLRKTEMLGDYSALGTLIGERSDARVRMAEDNAARAYYRSSYDPQKAASQRAVSDARALLAVVANNSVKADADRIDALIAKVDADLLAGSSRT